MLQKEHCHQKQKATKSFQSCTSTTTTTTTTAAATTTTSKMPAEISTDVSTKIVTELNHYVYIEN
jgi:hypothetical protein